MELENYILKKTLKKPEIDSQKNSLLKLTTAYKSYLKKTPSPQNLEITIIFRILKKDLEKKKCLIEILGLKKFQFYIFSEFITKQNYNIPIFITKVLYNTTKNYFLVQKISKIKILFDKIENMKGTTNNCIGSLLDPLLNLTMKGFFKDNFVDFDDLNDKNSMDNYKTLTGVIYKKFILKKAIILKIVDFRNLIDIHKVYINFKDDIIKKRLEPKLGLNCLVSFQNSIRQTISKKLKIVFSVNYDKFTEIKIKNIEQIDFIKQKIEKRIKNNIKSAKLQFTELCNISPFIFHRGIHKLLIEPISLFYANMKLYCKNCYKNFSSCFCEEKNFKNLNIFCILLCKQGDISFTMTIKKKEHFFNFFEICENEKKFIFDFLKNQNGQFSFSMKDFIDFKSEKAKLVRILHKLNKNKIIFGKFKAKENNKEKNKRNFFYFRKGSIYPNGIISDFSDNICYKLDFVVKSVGKDEGEVCRERFKFLMKKMVF